MKLDINIETRCVKWKNAFPRMKAKIEQAAALAVLYAKKPAALKQGHFEINILLTNNRSIKTLNAQYRGMDKATNVLSFPQFDMKGLKAVDLRGFPKDSAIPFGDVVVACETMRREAKEQQKTLENHTIHLIVHGVLHLFSYDHMNDRDAKKMETLECDILAVLGYPDPYHETKVKTGGRS
jgi:probable rRNA maturation factor